ncbi:MAG TPA: hypothetical protein VK620_33905 [Bradyrhizobium sp.]|nr:hypothetical protein [Bradyrhizobium sp.]
MIESVDWTIIDRAAEALGVKPESRKKWRQRGVPHRWRISIIRQTGGAIAAEQFEAFEKCCAARAKARARKRSRAS